MAQKKADQDSIIPVESGEELLEYVDDARKEIMTAVDNLSTDVNIRISDLEQALNDKAQDLDNRKVNRESLGEMLVQLGNKIKS